MIEEEIQQQKHTRGSFSGKPAEYIEIIFEDEIIEEKTKPCSEENEKWTVWYRKNFVGVFKLAWPMALTSATQYLIMPISVAFCGHLNVLDLAAVSIANTLINVTGLAIGTGLVTACDTFFSQIYGSADSNKKHLGVVLQRSLIIMVLACIPCWIIHLNAEPLLKLLGQEILVCEIAAKYLKLFIPGLLANFIYQVLMKYLQNQNCVMPLIVIGIIANGVNALGHYVLLFVLKTGTDGSAISQVFAHYTLMFGTIIYIFASGIYKSTWSGWSKECLKGWGKFIKYALPGSMMIFLDLFMAEVGMFLSGILGEKELGAMSVIHQITAVTYQISLGISFACSVRVGQSLGDNKPLKAKRTAFVAVTLVCFSGVVMALALVISKPYLPMIFTNDEEVIRISEGIIPIVAVYQVIDGIGSVCGGATRGSGRHGVGAASVFTGFYIIGMPIAVCLLFLTPLKTAGFWWGVCVAVVFNAIVLCTILRYTNWKRLAEQALMSLNEHEPIDDEIEDETTSLLPQRRRKNRIDSNLLCKRAAVVICLLILLGVGVFTSIITPPTPMTDLVMNTTMVIA